MSHTRSPQRVGQAFQPDIEMSACQAGKPDLRAAIPKEIVASLMSEL
mgnify:CR=1 FL=1